jgi:hypothetical protein
MGLHAEPPTCPCLQTPADRPMVTAHILLTTEQEAQELRRHTEEDCAQLRAMADADAQKVRDAADTYTEQVRAMADDDRRHTREDATARTTETIEEGLRRRGQIDDQIDDLETHRAGMLDELGRPRAERGATIDAAPARTVEELRARPRGTRRRACAAVLTLSSPERNGVGSPASGARTAPMITPTADDEHAPRESVTPLSLPRASERPGDQPRDARSGRWVSLKGAGRAAWPPGAGGASALVAGLIPARGLLRPLRRLSGACGASSGCGWR